jgi:hypothetical protein
MYSPPYCQSYTIQSHHSLPPPPSFQLQFDTQSLITGVVDTDPVGSASFWRIRIGVQGLDADPDTCKAKILNIMKFMTLIGSGIGIKMQHWIWIDPQRCL